jgi:hypothetical protein
MRSLWQKHLGVAEGETMTPSRQKKIRALLRSRPQGMTPIELSELLGIHVSNVRVSLKAMPDVYVDRWRAAKRGQFEKVWVAVPVPEDCPHPKDRLKWGTNTKKPRTSWVGGVYAQAQ